MPSDLYFSSSGFYVLLRRQDTAAFEQLYDRYAGALYGEIIRTVGEGPRAEALLTAVFVRVHHDIASFTGQDVTLFTWMLRITRILLTDLDRNGKG